MKKLRLSRLIWAGLAILSGILAFLSFQGAGRAAVLVEWSTASELNTAGFNLYRSESPDGPYQKVNKSLIPPAPDSLTGGAYSYTDPEVQGGKLYYYELEEIETTGEAARHGPIEVRAEGGSTLIGALAVGLGIISLAGLASDLRSTGRTRQPGEQLSQEEQGPGPPEGP